MTALSASVFETALGWAGVIVTDQGVRRVVLPARNRAVVERELAIVTGGRPVSRRLGDTIHMLERYFAGKGGGPCALRLDVPEASAFQQRVWRAACAIPYGGTRSYAWIARKIGSPRAARAVGNALGANPVPIVVPCHRVIASSGGLGGFSGGLEWKRRLLDLEGGAYGDSRVGGKGKGAA